MEEIKEVGADNQNDASASEPVEVPVPCKSVEEEEDRFYREMRMNETKDDLAIRVMNLANDTHTEKLKELAAKHLTNRFS